MTPTRVQLRRTKGWRKPVGAVVVSRPSQWGNPYVLSPYTLDGVKGWDVLRREIWLGSVFYDGPLQWHGSRVNAAAYAVERYADEIAPGLASSARAFLRRRDLCCWCPLDQACHADVLLEIANAPVGETA